MCGIADSDYAVQLLPFLYIGLQSSFRKGAANPAGSQIARYRLQNQPFTEISQLLLHVYITGIAHHHNEILNIVEHSIAIAKSLKDFRVSAYQLHMQSVLLVIHMNAFLQKGCILIPQFLSQIASSGMSFIHRFLQHLSSPYSWLQTAAHYEISMADHIEFPDSQ